MPWLIGSFVGRQSKPKRSLSAPPPTILAGVRTAAVINVGTATLGGFIGAGGYGGPILRGIDKFDVPLMLEGAVPAALLALLIEGLFELAERVCSAPRLTQNAGPCPERAASACCRLQEAPSNKRRTAHSPKLIAPPIDLRRRVPIIVSTRAPPIAR